MGEEQFSRSPQKRRSAIRILVLLGALLLVALAGSFVYLNSIGFPDFLKERIQNNFQARGIDLRIGAARLRGYREIEATAVRVALGELSLTAGHVRLGLDREALRKRSLRLSLIKFEGARLVFNSVFSNAPPAEITLEKLNADLELLPNDVWQVAQFNGRLLDADVRLTAAITNIFALRDWVSFKPAGRPTAEQKRRRHEAIARLNSVRLGTGTALELKVTADGARKDTLQADLRIQTPRATAPSGEITNLLLTARVLSARTNAMESDVHLKFDALKTSWGTLEAAELQVIVVGSLDKIAMKRADGELRAGRVATAATTNRNSLISFSSVAKTNASLFDTALRFRIGPTETPRASLAKADGNGTFTHALATVEEASGAWTLDAERVVAPFGTLESAQLTGRLTYQTNQAPRQLADASFGWWSRLEPYQLDWQAELKRIESPKAQIERASIEASWQAPELNVRDFAAELYGGGFNAAARLDVRSREVQARGVVDFDVHKISSLLTKNAQRWLGQFSWSTPPHVNAEARLILPSWTNREPDWQRDVLPTIQLAGDFNGTGGAFRGVAVSAAHSHFALTNFCWRLPDLVVTRPEGTARLDYWGDMRTQDFRWQVDGQVNPKAFLPLLEPSQTKALNQFEFVEAPLVRGEIWGRWHERDVLGFRGAIAATNFTFRGERCDSLVTDLTYTNRFFTFAQGRITRSGQEIVVPSAAYDLNQQIFCVTNATSAMDPDLVTKVIGPKVRAALSPYHFDKPPKVEINGILPTARLASAKVHFKVTGEDLNYWRFKLNHVSGDLYWEGETLSIPSLEASFYGGRLNGEGFFDFAVDQGTDLRFRTRIVGTDLRPLAIDLTTSHRHLEGALNGHLVVTSANSNDPKSWQGYGDVNLNDGFLWNIPIFGFFSPVVNKIVPGLGSSRASAGSASFTIDHSVIHTSDLEVRSPALRLQYNGQIDFEGRVDARMQAEVLRDAWAVGRMVSLALWPISKVFEYKITGTLHEPTSEPLYIPKLLTWPFRPLRVLRGLLSKEAPASEASSPKARTTEKADGFLP